MTEHQCSSCTPTVRIVMSSKYSLPAKGQIDLSEFVINANYGRARQVVVAQSKLFVDKALRAYSPQRGQHVTFVDGGARVVVEVLYELFSKAPEDAINKAIAWARDIAMDTFAPLDDIDLGSGHQGRVSQHAFSTGLHYFEESIQWTLAENRKSKAVKSKSDHAAKSAAANAASKAKWEANQARRTDERRNGYRKAAHLTQKVGDAIDKV